MTLQNKLYEKIRLEYDSFIEGLQNLAPRQIIEAAYEKVAKESILEKFEDKDFASDGQARYLLNQTNTLDVLYDTWLDVDARIGESIHACMEDYMFVISDMSLDLPGTAIEGDNVRGYIVQQAVLFENNVGFAFAHNPEAVSAYVTWRVFNEGGKLNYEWGNYFSDEEKALADYVSRYEDYTVNQSLTEIPIPPPTRTASVPYSDHTIITDITHTLKEPVIEEVDRTYKTEIELPDQQDYHLEVFSAENDVDAVKQAYELCEDWGEAILREVHELDENYDSIREIDLNTFDPNLRRFMDVDLFDFLGHISDKVIVHYRNDWNIDKEWLLRYAESADPNDKRLAWHVCATGTHLIVERDVFVKDSGAFSYWTGYHQKDPDMFGFYIEITGHENGRVYGNVFDVGNYAEHALHVWDTALPIDTVTLEYSESWGVNCGLTITVPRKEYDDDRHRLMCDSGNVISIKMNPLEGNITMDDVMKTEQAHRMGMPIGDTQKYLQKLEEKLFEIRGEPLKNAYSLVSGKPKEADVIDSAVVVDEQTKTVKPATTKSTNTKPAKPQSFDERLKQAQQKADNFNRQNAQNKGQDPVSKGNDKDKNNPQIGE